MHLPDPLPQDGHGGLLAAGAGGRVLPDPLRLLVRLWLRLQNSAGREERRAWEDLQSGPDLPSVDTQYALLGAVLPREKMPDRWGSDN